MTSDQKTTEPATLAADSLFHRGLRLRQNLITILTLILSIVFWIGMAILQ